MARYIQRIRLLGKERWIGWEVDGVGTEIPGLVLADIMTDEEIRARGIKEFSHLDFETFIGMGALLATPQAEGALLAEDIEFRLDALQVGMERYRNKGMTAVPREVIANIIGDDHAIDDPRVQQRFREWQNAGAVRVVGASDCYLMITGRLA
jgi:hypothetical protein